MRVLGIDPGTTATGYGVVELRRGRYKLVGCGVIRTSSKEPMTLRLARIHDGLVAALGEHRPDEVAIEAVFRHRSSASALVLGQARGVALLAVGQAGYQAHEYNAMTVKRSVGAHGRADKGDVRRMVEMLLGEEVPGPHDASDAVAIAITHCAHARGRSSLGGAR